jgi:hypothetical protein
MLGGQFQEPYDSLVPGRPYSVRSLVLKLSLEDVCARIYAKRAGRVLILAAGVRSSPRLPKGMTIHAQ